MPTTLKNSLTIIGGTGVTASNSGDPWDGTIPLNQQISVGNDISIMKLLQLSISCLHFSFKISNAS